MSDATHAIDLPPARAGEPHVAPQRRGWWRSPLATIVIAVLAAGAGVLLWAQVIRDRVIPHNWGVVEPGRIYRSGQVSGTLIKPMLEKNKVNEIIALSHDEPESSDVTAERRAADELGIPRLLFPLRGNGTGKVIRYAQAIAALDAGEKKGQVVLVHCEAGSQRTGGVVACYRVLVQHKAPQEAYAEMVRFGFNARRNPDLLPFLNQNMGELVADLVRLKVIDKIPDPLPVIGP